MIFAYVVALLIVALPGGLALPRLRLDARPAAALAWIAALALAAAFFAQQNAYDAAVAAQPGAAFERALPLHFFTFRPMNFPPARTADIELGLACAQSLALAVFLCALPLLARRDAAILTTLAGAALAVIALRSASADSPDAYSYVGLGLLGPSAYAPPPVPFEGEFGAINRIWGTPMGPSVYGPLWVFAMAAVARGAQGLAACLLTLKVVGALSVVACAVLARALRCSRAVIAAIVCNPGLYASYAASGHNDLVAVDFVLASLVAARSRRPMLAALFGACGGLVKVTVALVALVAASRLGARHERLRFCLALPSFVIVGYVLFAPGFAHALGTVAAANPPHYEALELALQGLAVACALGAIALAFVGRGATRTAWCLPALGQYPVAQYLGWGLPFALGSDAVALAFLATFPLGVFLLSPIYLPTALSTVVRGLLVGALAGAILIARRAR